MESLRDCLIEGIRLYLTYDNPKNEQQSRINTLFSAGGAAGRERAAAYRQMIDDNPLEEDLFKKVLSDLKGETNGLGSSRQLKRRIANAVCEALGISTQAVQDACDKTITSMASTGKAGAIPNIAGIYARTAAVFAESALRKIATSQQVFNSITNQML